MWSCADLAFPEPFWGTGGIDCCGVISSPRRFECSPAESGRVECNRGVGVNTLIDHGGAHPTKVPTSLCGGDVVELLGRLCKRVRGLAP